MPEVKTTSGASAAMASQSGAIMSNAGSACALSICAAVFVSTATKQSAMPRPSRISAVLGARQTMRSTVSGRAMGLPARSVSGFSASAHAASISAASTSRARIRFFMLHFSLRLFFCGASAVFLTAGGPGARGSVFWLGSATSRLPGPSARSQGVEASDCLFGLGGRVFPYSSGYCRRLALRSRGLRPSARLLALTALIIA